MSPFINQLAQRTGLNANVLWVLVAIVLVLACGSALRMAYWLRQTAGTEESRIHIASLAVWWILFALLVLVLLVGKAAVLVLFAGVSLLGLREFRALAQPRMATVPLWWSLVYLAVPVHYVFIYFGWLGSVWTFCPVWMLLILFARLVVSRQTNGFLETAGATFLGLMLIVFLFSHAVLLLALPGEVSPAGGSFGLLLFLILMTAVNDIAQALWGRQFGKRKIVPTVSPNKTWEGFLLGAATTVALGFVLAGLLTPFADQPMWFGNTRCNVPHLPVFAAGALIAVGGFFGDATMSAIKREVGAKDSGTLLPGQGGVLDRIDSLTFTGPLFFYFTYLFYGGGGEP